MMADWTPLITLLCCVGGFAISYFANRRTAKKDAEEQGKSGGMVLTELGYIKGGIDDIKRKQEQQDTAHHLLAQQVQVHAADIQGIKEDIKSLADKNSRDHGRFYETERELRQLQAVHDQIHGGKSQ